MKIYIAHNFAARDWLLIHVVPALITRGHEITSRWITDERCVQMGADGAQLDVEDVDRADAILFFVDQFGPTPGRGKYFELGYAVSAKKNCYLIGDGGECIFYHLPQMVRVQTLTDIPMVNARCAK